MINDCGQFQICNIDDRCIILEIVKFLHFYIYLQYTSDRQHSREYAQAGVSVGTVDRPGGGGGGWGGVSQQGSQGVGVKWGGGGRGDTKHCTAQGGGDNKHCPAQGGENTKHCPVE